MKILILSNLFPNAANPQLGIFVRRQADHFLDQGHQIRVIAPIPYLPPGIGLLPRWRRYRGQTRPFPCPFRVDRPTFFRPPGRWFAAYESRAKWRSVQRVIQSWEPGECDLVYAQGFSSDVAVGVAAARQLGVPCVGMAVGGDLNVVVTTQPQRRPQIIQSIRDCDAVVCNSHALVERVSELTDGEVKATRMTRGTDVAKFSPPTPEQRQSLRQKFGWKPDEIVFLQVAYIRPDKGVFDVIDAFAKVQREIPNCRCVLAGGGDHLQQAQQCVEDRSLTGSIEFLGQLPPDDVIDRYRAADVSMLASHAEGMPNAIIESIACGLPIIATRVGGIPEAVPPDVGRLVDRENPDQLAQAIVALASDPSLRQAMGRRARQVALEDFDATKLSQHLTDLFADVCQNFHPSPSESESSARGNVQPASSSKSD